MEFAAIVFCDGVALRGPECDQGVVCGVEIRWLGKRCCRRLILDVNGKIFESSPVRC